MSPLVWAMVAIAGALGTVARYLLDGLVSDRVGSAHPWGTFVINVTGSFLLGGFTGLHLAGHLGDAAIDVVGIGFCGAFTTFSTFSYESVRLIEAGDHGAAAMNVLGSLGVGLLAAGAGLALAASTG